MKRIGWFLTLVAACWCAGVATPPLAAQEVAEPQFVIIGHVGAPDTLTQDDIKQIFLGHMTRKNGQSLVFVLLKDDRVYAAFLKAHVGKTVTQYTNYWKKQVFTGKGRMPRMFEEPADVHAYVAETEGAIGFVPPDLPLDETVRLITAAP